MLETIRKHHYILMTIIAAVVIVAFTFLYDPNMGGRGPGGPVARWNGKDIYREEMQEIDGQRGFAMEMFSLVEPSSRALISGDPVARYVDAMHSIERKYQDMSANRDTVDYDFVYNVMVLRDGAKKLGIDVKKEDVEKLAQVVLPFQTNGRFDSRKYRDFVAAGRGGGEVVREKRLSSLLRDALLFRKLSELIGGTYEPSKAEVDYAYASQYAEVTTATALVEKEKHPGEPVTDEDLQKFYDEEKTKPAVDEDRIPDLLVPGAEREESKAADPVVLSEEKRTVNYVLVPMPERPAAPVPPVQEDLSALPEDQKKAKEEEFAKKQEEFRSETDAYADKLKAHEADRAAQTERASKLSNALNAEDRGTRTFEEIAREWEFEPAAAGPAARDAMPDDLKNEPGLVEAIFEEDPGTGIAHTVRTSKGYAFFEIAESEPPVVRPFEEVKDAIRTKLEADRATEALKAAAEAARTKLKEALEAKTPFVEAAEAEGLKITRIPAFSGAKPPADAASYPHYLQARSAVASLNPGDISEPLEVPEGQVLVWLEKRELPNVADMETRKQDIARMRTAGGGGLQINPFTRQYEPLTSPLLAAWFEAKRSEAVEVAPGIGY